MSEEEPARWTHTLVTRGYEEPNLLQKKGQELIIGSKMTWRAVTRKRYEELPLMTQVGVWAGTLAGGCTGMGFAWNIGEGLLPIEGGMPSDLNLAHMLANYIMIPLAGMVLGGRAGNPIGTIALTPAALIFAKVMEGVGVVLEKSGDGFSVAQRGMAKRFGRPRGPWDPAP